MRRKISKKRDAAVIALIALVFAAFIIRLWNVQVVSAGDKGNAAVKAVEVEVEPVRGDILDRSGNILATSKQQRNVVFSYVSFPKSSEKQARNKIIGELITLFEKNGAEWIDELPIKLKKNGELAFSKNKESEVAYLRSSAFLDLNPYATVQNCFDALVSRYSLESYDTETARKLASVYYSMWKDGFNSTAPYTFAKDVSPSLSSLIKEKSAELPGVDVQVKSVRYYPDGTLAPHVLGIVGAIDSEEYEEKKADGYTLTDTVGKNGIEYAYESELRGKKGKKLITTDSDGNTTEKYTVLPENGNSVVLTLDARLQKTAQTALAELIKQMQKTNPNVTSGATVAMDVKTGEVLACANYPGYNLSTYSKNSAKLNADASKPLWDRALRSTFTPGSTIKPAVAMAGLEEKTIDEKSVVRCTGIYTHYEDYRPRCTGVHGSLDVVSALYHSCNIFFYETSRLLGIEKLNDYFKMFGLGEKTGVELAESSGTVDSVELRTQKGELWTPGLTIQAGIGHGDNQFTPIQLCAYATVIANKGVRRRAHFVGSVMTADYSQTLYTAENRVLSTANFKEDNWALVYEGMLLVGTKSYANFTSVGETVAAKTGTTTVERIVNGRSKKHDNGLIIAFAPYDDPQIAVSVVVEGAESGGSTAPVAAAIMKQYFSKTEGEKSARTQGSLLK